MRLTDRGFSLTELIIVLAVFGIVAAIASPSFSSYRDNVHLREAVRQISGDMGLCRQRAVAENMQYKITFDAQTMTYSISRKPVPVNIWTTVATGIPICAGKRAIVFSKNPSFSGGVSSVTFHPRGTSGLGSLTLKHERTGRRMTLTTTITGRIRISKN
ncbi:MAG TPA: prepilin-type N-terminal cleavage/methylation domain-containing protein [Smithellaceae bacterium]|nr:prepilin-type N-terminal cleavage/methylation domain-containing protein [Smithellaceae bacterium]